ncbi:MAG: FadR/GntR family transcriptional regulator [Trueperaceae bacterium]
MTTGYKVERASLTEQVSHLLQRYIEEHDLRPGDELPTEMELTQMFGVSRTVIREGLSAASALGLIVAETGRRSRVAELSPRVLDRFFTNALRLNTGAVAELLEVREALETFGVTLAARNPEPSRLEELAGHLWAMDQALREDRQDAFVEADIEFHLTLVEMSGNEILRHLIGALRSSTRQTIASGLQARGSNLSLAAIQEVHVKIFDTVMRGEPEAAAAAMTEHFELAIAAVRNRDGAAKA